EPTPPQNPLVPKKRASVTILLKGSSPRVRYSELARVRPTQVRCTSPAGLASGTTCGTRMADSAFARCQKFLGYHPAAQWLSIVSSILSAIIYVSLIVLLGLFIDLMVERGEIPSFHQLSRQE